MDIPKKLVPLYKKVYNYTIRTFLLKHKRIFLVASATLFLVVLFLGKNTSIFKNTIDFVKNKKEGLIYDTAIVEDLINKDTDGDGVLDWEEPLYGLDPNQKETTPGVPDSTVIEKLRTGQENTTTVEEIENLTKTDKFSRELFTTIASLNQSGSIDQATIDQISGSLVNQIKNYTPKKIFIFFDLKTIKSGTAQDIKNYKNTLITIIEKNKMPDYSAMDVLERFIINENNVDSSVLTQLDPIIESFKKRIEGIVKMGVPQSLAFVHIDLLNGMQRVMENLNDIKLYEDDPIVSLSAVSQYEKNITLLDEATLSLEMAVNNILNN